MEKGLRNHRYIVVILHGYTMSTSRYQSIRRVVESCYGGAKILIPKMPLHSISTVDPNVVVQSILDLIDDEWSQALLASNSSGELPKIVLIGHSTGSLLVRKVYICACGENKEAPFEDVFTYRTSKSWAKYVERIILFAGMNRGWSLNPHLYERTALLMFVGIVVGYLMESFGLRPLAFQTRRGASFITQLRIQWLSMLRHVHEKDLGHAMVIQLLGTVDDLISPDDDIDLVTGNRFIYLDVPMSGHIDVLDMDAKVAGEKRREVFVKALTFSQQELEKIQIIPSDRYLSLVDESVTDVVFVVHGIRDTGFWTQKLARRVKTIGDATGKKYAMETSSYGYFPMLAFLLFSRRRAKVEWLMDQYTENLAHYPNAQFSFIGHSHGTYLLAKALKEYPACKFNRVLFAGSVVSQNYDWELMLKQKRVHQFYNVVAASDWVVACFPKSFQRLRLQDLGSGGYDGFLKLDERSQLKYVPGNHSAALEEKYWDAIANFIVHGTFSINDGTVLNMRSRSPVMTVLGGLAPLPFMTVILLLILIAVLIWNMECEVGYKVLVECVYLFFIWKGVTWF